MVSLQGCNWEGAAKSLSLTVALATVREWEATGKRGARPCGVRGQGKWREQRPGSAGAYACGGHQIAVVGAQPGCRGAHNPQRGGKLGEMRSNTHCQTVGTTGNHHM